MSRDALLYVADIVAAGPNFDHYSTAPTGGHLPTVERLLLPRKTPVLEWFPTMGGRPLNDAAGSPGRPCTSEQYGRFDRHDRPLLRVI